MINHVHVLTYEGILFKQMIVFCTVCSSTVIFILYILFFKLHFETAWAFNCNMILCFVKQYLKKSVTSNEKLIIENDIKMLFP